MRDDVLRAITVTPPSAWPPRGPAPVAEAEPFDEPLAVARDELGDDPAAPPPASGSDRGGGELVWIFTVGDGKVVKVRTHYDTAAYGAAILGNKRRAALRANDMSQAGPDGTSLSDR